MSESVKAMPDYARVEALTRSILANVEQRTSKHVMQLAPWRRLMESQIKAFLMWEEGERVRATDGAHQMEAGIRFMAWLLTRLVCSPQRPYNENLHDLLRLTNEVQIAALALMGNPQVMPNDHMAGHG